MLSHKYLGWHINLDTMQKLNNLCDYNFEIDTIDEDIERRAWSDAKTFENKSIISHL